MGRFWQHAREWERPAQIAFGSALLLLAITIAVLVWGPGHLRQPALIGVFGLVVIGQMVVMWANRGMVTPYTRAQRLYLAEDFEGASDLLEPLRAAGKADTRALTLLGNIYRQRGLLAKSEEVLTEALALQPDHYFPLYGFGRTLLVQGRYPEAAQILEQALTAGAPGVVQMDIGEAYYRSGQSEKASEQIAAVLGEVTEPHRQLMGMILLFQMKRGAAPSASQVANGFAYWQAQAKRYAQTPYGHALSEDVRVMQTMMEET